jgi:hypothetical protein
MPKIFGGYGVSETNDGLPVTISRFNSFIKPHTCRSVLYIPAHEVGLCSIVHQFPEYFVELSSFLDPFCISHLRDAANHTGDWSAVYTYTNSIYHSFVASGDARILIVNTPKYIKVDNAFLEFSIMYRNGNGIIENSMHRKHIRECIPNSNIHYVRTRANMIAIALSFVSSVLNGGTTWSCVMNTNKSPPPVYKQPSINSTGILKRSKPAAFIDAQTLHRHGVDFSVEVQDAILSSALTGGWPKQALNQSLADYAKELLEWTNKSKLIQVTLKSVILVKPTAIQSIVQSVVEKTLGLKGYSQASGETIFSLNTEGYPITTRLRHSYNCLSAYMRPFGCSVLPTLYKLIDNRSGSTRLEKLHSLAVSESHRLAATSAEFQRLKELVARCEYWLTGIPSQKQSKDTPSGLKDTKSSILCNFGFKWMAGDLDLIPSHNPGVATDIVSYNRDMTLHVIENHDCVKLRRLYLQEPQTIAISIHALERQVMVHLLTTLNSYCPGIIYKD